MVGVLFAVFMTVYGLANLVFAFIQPPAGIVRFLGPDRRTRGLLFFVPDDKLESIGRFVYGLACLFIPAILLYVQLVMR